LAVLIFLASQATDVVRGEGACGCRKFIVAAAVPLLLGCIEYAEFPVTLPGQQGPSRASELTVRELAVRNLLLRRDSLMFMEFVANSAEYESVDPPPEFFDRISDLGIAWLPASRYAAWLREHPVTKNFELPPCVTVGLAWHDGDQAGVWIVGGYRFGERQFGSHGQAIWKHGVWALRIPKSDATYVVN